MCLNSSVGNANKLQALPNELTLMSTNLPSGYHREMQLFKGPIMQAIDEIKSCLSMTTSSIKEVQVKGDILSDEKYTHVFSVDALHELIQQGVPFRMPMSRLEKPSTKGNLFLPKWQSTPIAEALAIWNSTPFGRSLQNTLKNKLSRRVGRGLPWQPKRPLSSLLHRWDAHDSCEQYLRQML